MNYKEKLEEAKRLYELANDDQKHVLESLFPELPELTESEDERIRKNLITCISTFKHPLFSEIERKEFLGWLEKQVPVDEEKVVIGVRKDIALSIMNFFNKNTLGMGLSNMECEDLEEAVVDSDWLKVYRYMKKKIEKQGEQKPADKVKFKVGDWVVSPNGVYWHIDKIYNNRYEVTANTGESSNWNLDTNIYHKFTIQDVNKGDVLVGSYGTFIFMGKSDGYCGVLSDNTFIRSTGNNEWTKGLHPATKEQRDTLIKAMADAGYTFDFEKKELKLLITNGGDFETENCEQKPAWSEEDDAYKIFAISAVEDFYDEKNPLRKCLVDWLNSLKQRINNV